MNVFSNQIRLIAAMVIGLGVFIRCYGLDIQSFWIDELFTVESLYSYNINEYFSLWILPEPHTPLYPLILYYWSIIFGKSEFALRMLSALFGSTSLLFIYIFGNKIFKNKEIWAINIILNSLSTTAILYSQEARTYSLLLAMSIVTTYLFIYISEILRDKKIVSDKIIFFYTFSLLLCSFSHYYGMAYAYFQIFFILLFLIKYKYYKFVSALFVVVLISFVWFIYHISHIKVANSWIGYADLKLLVNFVAHVFGKPALGFSLIPENDIIFRLFSYLLVFIGPLFLIFIPLLVYLVTNNLTKFNVNFKNFSKYNSVIYICFFPLFSLFLLGTLVKILWVQYLIFLLPPLYILISQYIYFCFEKHVKYVVYYVAFICLLNFSLFSYSFYRPYKEDIRSVVKFAAEKIKYSSNSIIYFNHPFLFNPYLRYYNLFDNDNVFISNNKNFSFSTNDYGKLYFVSINRLDNFESNDNLSKFINLNSINLVLKIQYFGADVYEFENIKCSK